MTILPALSIAFAAFCVWLMVRIVNRRERWAKWTLGAVVGVPLLYVASMGPVVWSRDRHFDYWPDGSWIAVGTFYTPIFWAADNSVAARGAMRIHLELWTGSPDAVPVGFQN